MECTQCWVWQQGLLPGGAGRAKAGTGTLPVGTASSSTRGWDLQTALLSTARQDQGLAEEISSGLKPCAGVRPTGKVTPFKKSYFGRNPEWIQGKEGRHE